MIKYIIAIYLLTVVINLVYVFLQRKKMAKYIPVYFAQTSPVPVVPIICSFVPLYHIFFLLGQIALYEMEVEEYKELFKSIEEEMREWK